MHVTFRWLPTLLIVLPLFLTPLGASHTYYAESGANFTETGLVNNKIGVLVGTLVLDPTLPVRQISFSPTISSSPVKMYYTTFNQLNNDNLSGSLYVTYFRTNGTMMGVTVTNQSSLNLNALDMNFPITFYVLVDSSDYQTFTRKVRGFIFQSQNRFVSMGTNSAFTVLSPSNVIHPVISNQGETTLPTPLVCGGIPGPVGYRTIAIGDAGVQSSWFFPYNIADQPVYNIFFTTRDVYIQDIQQAVHSPLNINSIILEVENFTSTYLGESRVAVRFYQAGFPSFRFRHETYSTSWLPFTLWVNQQPVPYNIPFSPWPAPMSSSNAANISLKVSPQDLEATLAGSYTTTITVEIISGI